MNRLSVCDGVGDFNRIRSTKLLDVLCIVRAVASLLSHLPVLAQGQRPTCLSAATVA